jgi:restriction system protein
MSRDEQEAGLSGLLFGERWQTAAWRALTVFVLFYVLTAIFLASTSRLAAFLQWLATVVCFVLVAGAVYKLLQSRVVEDGFDEDEDAVETPQPVSARSDMTPVTAATSAEAVSVEADASTATSAPAPAFESLSRVALERLCMALYRFNGLSSQTVATGADGEYRIRLVPRNAEKAIAILQCRVGAEQQDVQAYAALLRVMEEEELEKAFFVAPAGFVPEVTAQARAKHVTLVDLRLLQAMLDRLPDSARASVYEAVI